MRESKAQLTDRLRAAGRWSEFVARREELKRDGLEAAEAWDMAAREFRPDEPDRSVEPVAAPLADLTPLRDKPAVSPTEATQWVFERLDDLAVTPAECPSLGAWSMLMWARTDRGTRSEFYRTFAAKLLPSRGQVEEEDEDERDEHPDTELLAILQRRLVGADRQESPSRAVVG